jgi:hypothetical protein
VGFGCSGLIHNGGGGGGGGGGWEGFGLWLLVISGNCCREIIIKNE